MASLFRLTSDTVAPAPGTKLLKAEDYALLLEANTLLDAARRRASEIE